MRIFITSIVISFALSGAMTTVAQTPDGQTPANEGVCDGLVGLTPGLYGLCVAYCEAQDLDTIDATDPDAFKQAPSRRILDNYRKKMKAGDPDMPCIRQPCPCWSQFELDGLRYPANDVELCRKDESFPPSISRLNQWGLGEVFGPYETYLTTGHFESVGNVCSITDICTDGNCLRVFRSINGISADEMDACEAGLKQSAVDRGIECFLE